MKARRQPRPKDALDTDALVGQRIKLRRKMLGMSQERLGAQIGLTFQQVQKYEHAGNRVSASKLYEIARTLNVPIAFFFDTADPVNAPPFVDEPPAKADDPLYRADSQALLAAWRALGSDRLRAAFVRLLEQLVTAAAEAAAPPKRRRRVA